MAPDWGTNRESGGLYKDSVNRRGTMMLEVVLFIGCGLVILALLAVSEP